MAADEIGQGDSEAAAERLTLIESIPLLGVTEDVIRFADSLVENKVVPHKAAIDALHIGVACANGINYLLTWNCTHIANAQYFEEIEKHCAANSYIAPIICTPEELLGDYAYDVERPDS